jgi:hypothetical protein
MMSINQNDDDGVAVIVMARMQGTGYASTHDGTDRAPTSRVPMMILALENSEASQHNAYPSPVDVLSALNSSRPLRC